MSALLWADIFIWTKNLNYFYICAVKKLIHILFAVIYLFITMGLTITAHYCGGEIESISLSRTLNDEDPCGECETSCCDPCCEDEIQTIKLTDQHTFEAKFKQEPVKVILAFINQVSSRDSFSNHIHFFSGNELLLNSPPVNILNCTLLI